jgi:hypothetical protein
MSAYLAAYNRDQIVRNGRAIIVETVDARKLSTFFGMIAGTVYYVGVPLIAGDLIANITVFVSVAAVGITLSKVGLYSATGTLLASSVDQGTNWQTTGQKTVALQAAYTAQSTGLYYAAAVESAVTTQASIGSGTATTRMASATIGSGSLQMAAQTGQVDLPAPGTIAAGNLAAGLWMALS